MFAGLRELFDWIAYKIINLIGTLAVFAIMPIGALIYFFLWFIVGALPFVILLPGVYLLSPRVVTSFLKSIKSNGIFLVVVPIVGHAVIHFTRHTPIGLKIENRKHLLR